MSTVEIKPDVLEYKSPLAEQSTEYATVTNNSTETVAFKVKTTAPKFYCVRPNAAVVAPGETIQIQVIFLGLPEEPTVETKCRDKFLVITLPAPYDLGEKSVAEAWTELEAQYGKQAVSKKIKVKYVVNSDNISHNHHNHEEAATTSPSHNEHHQDSTNAAVPVAASAVSTGVDAVKAATSDVISKGVELADGLQNRISSSNNNNNNNNINNASDVIDKATEVIKENIQDGSISSNDQTPTSAIAETPILEKAITTAPTEDEVIDTINEDVKVQQQHPRQSPMSKFLPVVLVLLLALLARWYLF